MAFPPSHFPYRRLSAPSRSIPPDPSLSVISHREDPGDIDENRSLTGMLRDYCNNNSHQGTVCEQALPAASAASAPLSIHAQVVISLPLRDRLVSFSSFSPPGSKSGVIGSYDVCITLRHDPPTPFRPVERNNTRTHAARVPLPKHSTWAFHTLNFQQSSFVRKHRLSLPTLDYCSANAPPPSREK